MAKKKKRKKSIGSQIKYEVYGIILITLSIIALSGEATVGRALSKLFGLFLGKFYFVIAIVGVVIGLSVMIKRQWPKGWSVRRTGIVVLVVSATLSSSISHMNHRMIGLEHENLSAGFILQSLDYDIRNQLLVKHQETNVPINIRDMSISGGYVGAIVYSFLFMLFGYYGALVINCVLYLIAFLLITGKSYVEMIRYVRKGIRTISKLIGAKVSTIRAKQKAVAKVQRHDDYVDDDEEQFEEVEVIKPKRSSAFFDWSKSEPVDHWEPKEDHDENDILVGYKAPIEEVEQVQQALEVEQTQEEAQFERHATIHNINTYKEKAQTIEEIAQSIEQEQQAYKDKLLQASTLEGIQPHDHDQTDSSINDKAESMPDESEDDDYDYPTGQAQLSEALITEDSLHNQDDAGTSPEKPAPIPYQLPAFHLLNKPAGTAFMNDTTEMYDSKRKLEATLESFGVRAKVLDVVRGPAVTRYEVQPATGVKVSRIVSLTDDIALALAAKDVRMEAPIPGKSAIGIEVPNGEISVVTMREVMETPVFMNAASKLSIAFGRDISGQTIVGNLAKMPHLLVAGATGSGKSVCINGIIASILYKAKPDEVKFLMIDPKMVELNVYNGIPHLLAPVVTNPKRASLALKKIVVEMEKRYELFSKTGTRNIEGYNQQVKHDHTLVLPYIVVIVDELADLMMVASNEVEDSIARLAQMARAAGIHLIIATQRPSVDVITGVIKANIPSRIAFGVSSQVDSRTILDSAGAEKLLGRGDMLFLPMGMNKPIRVQGAFLSDEEVENIVSYVSSQGEVQYNDDLVPELDDDQGVNEEELDELFDQAVKIVVESGQASVSLLQRRLRVGYARAARLIDQLEAKSIVGPYEGSKPRSVLISLDQYNAK